MSQGNYTPGEYYRYPLIIKTLLDTPLVYSPEKEIVYHDKTRYTYKDLYVRICRLANGLAKLGINEGDVVAVMDYDSPRYLECFFAIPMMGAVLQTVNWRLSDEQILYTLQHAEAKAILVNDEFLAIVERFRDRLKNLKTVVVIQEEGRHSNITAAVDATHEDMMASAETSYDFPDLDENTKATTFYTTGTTGNPKGVYYSHRQLLLHTLSVSIVSASYHTICRFRSNDVYMPLTPMFHVHAWGFPYVSTLIGAKQVYPGPYLPEKILDLIETEQVTFSHCVPTVLQMIVTCPAARSVDLSNWKVVVGGAQLPKGLAVAAMNLGIEIHAGYGMSETCPVMTNAAPHEHMLDWTGEKYLNVITRTGRPLPLTQVEVVDGKDEILPHDGISTGEVVMRSPWLTQSYFKDLEKTKELWRNGWLHSGDVGFIDTHGYLQITDRMKDVIKSGGEWVSSLDLENLMSRHEAVLESAAIGIPDPKWGERPLMIITLKPEYRGKVTAEDCRAYLLQCASQGKLPRYGVPDRYEFVEALPKTSVGKLDKKLLRKQYRSR